MDVFGPCLTAYVWLVMLMDFDVNQCLFLLGDWPGGSDFCWDSLYWEVANLWVRYLDCVFGF